MGYVRVRGQLGDPEKRNALEVDFLTDTGSFYTVIPRDLAEKLGIRSVAKRKVTLADKREVDVDLSMASLTILDREAVLPVAILDVPEPLLGVTALEGLGLRVDPVSGVVEKTRSFTIGIMPVVNV